MKRLFGQCAVADECANKDLHTQELIIENTQEMLVENTQELLTENTQERTH